MTHTLRSGSSRMASSAALWTFLSSVLFFLPASGGEISVIDGVTHILNDAEPAQGLQTLRLEELWRAGGEDDEVFFGLIGMVCSDPAGNIYVLDSQVCQVYLYSPDGELLQTLFREGDGPGEIRRARSMVVLGDGSIGVIQEFPGRMVRVDRANKPLPSINLSAPEGEGMAALDGCFAGGPTLVFSGTLIKQAIKGVQERKTFLSIFSLEGQELARLAINPSNRDFNNFVFAEKCEMPCYYWANCVDGDGRVYTAPRRDEYAVEVYSPEGKLERVIKRNYQHLKRSAVERRRIHDMLDSLFQGFPIDYSIEIEEYDYDILAMQGGVRVRDDGTLWILSSRGAHDQPAGMMMTFDVFDPEGHFQRQVALKCDHDGLWDGLFFTGKDRAVVVTRQIEAKVAQYGDGASVLAEDEGSAMEVICYRMVAAEQ